MATVPRKTRSSSRDAKPGKSPDIRFEASFLPPERGVAELERAVGLLAVPGTPQFDRYLEAARCPIPPYGLADGLLRDAHAVLAGNPFAVRSFVETAEQLAAGAGHDDGELPPDLFEKRDEKHRHRQWTPDDGPAVSPASSLPIMAAAATIARAGLYPMAPLFRGFMRLFCHFEDLGRVHRLAVAAGGSPAALERFRAELDWRLPECGPMPGGPDEGIPLPERRNCLPWLDWHKECLRDVAPATPGTFYVINSVTPAVACPGDRILIRGTGFGISGLVAFRRLGGGDMKVAAESWTDTEIEVIVPAGAGGGLWLEIRAGEALVCGVLIPMHATGAVYENFDGTAPFVEALHLGGSHVGPYVVRPGGSFAVHWRAYGATGRTLTVSDENGAVLLQIGPNLPAVGVTSAIVASNPAAPVRWRARLVATGGCSPGQDVREIDIWVSADPALVPTGIEVTQAIQYFRSAEHLTDAADRQGDNAMGLVRSKAAWVRVYVASFATQMPGHAWPDVSGELTVERLVDGAVAASFVLASTAPSISVRPNAAYADVRGNIARTLNFVIPAGEAHGKLRLVARCRHDGPPIAGPIGEVQTTVAFALAQRLRVAGIMVAFDGPPMPNPPPNTPNLQIAAPTLADLDATLGYTLATMPVAAAFESRDAGAVTLNVPLNDLPPGPGGCTPNGGVLRTQDAQARDADGNQAGWFYYGLLPGGVPMGPVIGCGGGVATGSAGDVTTLAHEVGHVAGRAHAPCGNVGTPDATYPAYEPYDAAGVPGARLGEYGLDIRTGAIHPPTEFDFMSYCGPQWVSLHNHGLYLNAASFNPVLVPVGMKAGAAARVDLLCLAGHVDEDDRVHIDSVARASLASAATVGRATRIQAELLDAKGRKLGYGWIHAVVPEAHGGCAGCGGASPGEPPRGPYLIEARLPVVPGAAQLRIRDGEKVLWSRSRWKQAPTLDLTACDAGADGTLKLGWMASVDPEAEAQVWVQWAPAPKARLSSRAQWTHPWRGLAVGLRNGSAQLRTDALGAGRVLVRVLLHDGFSTVAALGEATLPERAPRVSIVHPAEGDKLPGGQGLLLAGRAVEASGRAVDPERLVWRLDGETVGRGTELRLAAGTLKAGAHEAALAVDGKFGSRPRSVKFLLQDG